MVSENADSLRVSGLQILRLEAADPLAVAMPRIPTTPRAEHEQTSNTPEEKKWKKWSKVSLPQVFRRWELRFVALQGGS